MPQIIDATVVDQAYDTSGNGGRKLVRLDNGWLVAVTKTQSTNGAIDVFINKLDGRGFLKYARTNMAELSDVAIQSKGMLIYILTSNTNGVYIKSCVVDATTLTSDSITLLNVNFITVDSGQSALGNVSLAINEQGTELDRKSVV